MDGELIGLLIGLVLTLFIYSYVIGDNPLYRLAVHMLVGVSAAYAAVVVIRQVVMPAVDQIRQNPTDQASLLWLVPFIFVLLLLLKRVPTLAWLGNNSVAFLVGVGAATALLGALTGTLWPQVMAASSPNAPQYQGILIAVLTVATLFVFQFTGRVKDGQWKRPFWQQGVAQIGRAALMIAFGALFAALFNTSLILLSSRFSYFVTQLQ
ncbi:MAG: hypothetical protein GY803_17110 [Chloroflexi bacterium]|nr:hypothetical protein [Chloroflexota bacterium]